MAEGEIHGMITSEAASCQGHARIARFIQRPAADLVEQQPVIKRMVMGTLSGRNGFIIPAHRIQAVGAIDLYLSVLQEPTGRVDQALVLILVIAALGGGEKDQRMTCMTEYEHFEISSDDRGMPFMIFFA